MEKGLFNVLKRYYLGGLFFMIMMVYISMFFLVIWLKNLVIKMVGGDC